MFDRVIEFLVAQPLLLLFIVTAIGYPLGRIRIAGASLGVAAVLFVGLAIGALDPRLKLPNILFELGLVVFMYTIGLASGPGFVASMRRRGLRDNALALAVLLMAALLVAGLASLLKLAPTVAAGLYTGALTNTPALAGLLDTIQRSSPADAVNQLLAEVTTGYAVAYPGAVLGMILVIAFFQKRWRINYAAEAAAVQDVQATSQQLFNRTILVTQTAVLGQPLRELVSTHGWDVVFGRMKRDGRIALANGDTRFELGDLVSVIGTDEDTAVVIQAMGELSDVHLEMDRSEYDFRRVFVSNPRVAGQRLRDLNLPQQYGAIVTRVRRGDIEFLAHADTVFELGDRVRVVARTQNMDAVSKFFGDSYRDLSEIDLLSLGLGVAMGMLLGLAPIPLPGGGVFTLGLAGGPLIVGLILGARGRTGAIVWQLPYSANLVLRQIALIILLASIGLRSGYTFLATLIGGGGLALLLAGLVVTIFAGTVMLVVGYKGLKIPMGLLSGMVAGMQTQPAVLGFASDQADNELPNVGYATIFPLATIAKILLAQVLLRLL